ncbi:MAG: PilZ domain-containing protein [Sphingomicrobium sp.]
MNKFRSTILSGMGFKSVDPLVHGKQARGADSDDLSSIEVPRSEARSANHREDDRHRLAEEQALVRHDGEDHAVDLINLSGGGAMIRADFTPRLWDRVDLILAEGAEIECAVRWLRGDRVGLEFAHETRIDCSPEARDALLLDVVRRSFPDLAPKQREAVADVPEVDEADAASRRSERRHPLIWMGDVIHNHSTERVRLRNISEQGAMIEGPASYKHGAELLLDLGEAGQHFATVGWTCADKAGLVFAKPFNLALLSKTRPEVASGRPGKQSALRHPVDDNSPWADGWQRQSVDELRESLEGFLKR